MTREAADVPSSGEDCEGWRSKRASLKVDKPVRNFERKSAEAIREALGKYACQL
jgi:hypothetical protein